MEQGRLAAQYKEKEREYWQAVFNSETENDKEKRLWYISQASLLNFELLRLESEMRKGVDIEYSQPAY